MIRAKIISSLEKVRLTDKIADLEAVTQLKAARGERVSFQVAVEDPLEKGVKRAMGLTISMRSRLSKYIRGFSVGQVPMAMPVYVERYSGEYITTEPGLMPDVLYPLKKQKYYTQLYSPVSFLFTAELPRDLEPGKYPVCITLKGVNDGVAVKVRLVIEVVEAVLPENDLRYTQWFHCDSIASYFGVKMQSQKHWKLIEKFIATAAHTGITMLLTPIFTPPLDTAIGTYRATMQLVDMEKKGDTYTFGFAKLERWVALCKKYGIDIVSLDCDGVVGQLLPTWVNNGVNTMFPIEVGVWGDQFEPARQKFGKELLGVGGMNKLALREDKAAVDKEVERMKRLASMGGFIPCPDHRLMPGTKFELVQYYAEQIKKITL